MTVKRISKRTRSAPTQQLLIQAVASDFPRTIHTSATLPTSSALLEALKESGAAESESAIKRSLGRAKMTALREIVVLDARDSRVMLTELGMVAVSVSLTSLNEAYRAWLKQCGAAWKDAHLKWRKAGNPRLTEPRPAEPEPSQESIVHDILERAQLWIKTEHDLEHHIAPPMLVLDASIVHGSSAFDILLTVQYRSLELFTRFVREVVQRAPHVHSSQTLQVPYRIGLPNLTFSNGNSPGRGSRASKTRGKAARSR